MHLIVYLTIKSKLLHQLAGLITTTNLYYHDRLYTFLMCRIPLHIALFSTT